MKTTQDMVDEVISRLDLNNRESVTIDKDILPALNRGWDDALSIVAQRSEEFMLTASYLTELQVDDHGNYYFLFPADCYQQRMLDVNVRNLDTMFWYPVQLNNAQESYKNELGNLRVGIRRMQYYTMGRKVVLLPQEDCKYVKAIRFRYLKRPPALVLQQGQITDINIENGQLILEDISPDLSTQIGNKANFINIVDVHSGEIRSTHQLQRIDGSKITIKTTPTRSVIMELPVTGIIPSTVDLDDYVCIAPGTCVPFIEAPVTSLAIEHAISEIQRKLGETDQQILTANVDRREKKVNDLAVNRPRRKRRQMSAPWSSRKY